MGGMPLFDAFCHTFGTLATGGFSTKNASIGHYNSVYFDVVITVFMLLSGINFALYYHALRSNLKKFYTNSEMRFFIGVFTAGTVVVGCALSGPGSGYRTAPGPPVRGFSGGFHSHHHRVRHGTDYEQWPYLAQIVLMTCIFIGGSTGSTGGSIKCMRIMLLFKHGYQANFRTDSFTPGL